jgi:hypothetical protein
LLHTGPMDVAQIASVLQRFTGSDLTSTLAKIEDDLKGLTADQCAESRSHRTYSELAEAVLNQDSA